MDTHCYEWDQRIPHDAVLRRLDIRPSRPILPYQVGQSTYQCHSKEDRWLPWRGPQGIARGTRVGLPPARTESSLMRLDFPEHRVRTVKIFRTGEAQAAWRRVPTTLLDEHEHRYFSLLNPIHQTPLRFNTRLHKPDKWC